ncbi:MAG TPA: quinohemoprotein amine dehydrogenase subunit alpha [Porticoccus sp.]|nr:quinohemoprotein amine dehydrogenase subunit alpha [Porticoccus sp.]
MLLLGPCLMAAANASEELLQQYCQGCHVAENNSPLMLSRISHQRKTPEGWLMSIARMQVVHKLTIDDQDRATLVKHLADTQGLAPSEAEPYRYILERRLNHQEQMQPQLAEMCARCHSEARVGLQRREEAEWSHLVHFHLGQWPSTEFSLMGRDRDWFGIAINEVVPFLGKHYGLQTEAWDSWKKSEKTAIDGRWRIVGHMPGKGDFQGIISLKAASNEHYPMSFTGQFDNGESLQGDGQVILYSGFEWRGSLMSDGKRYKQVFALSEDASELNGRMFLDDHVELGLDVKGVRGKAVAPLSLTPSYLQAGQTTQVTIRGANLKGTITLGGGVKLLSEISRSADQIVVEVQAPKTTTAFVAAVSVDGAALDTGLTVYDEITSIKVAPNYAVARVGDGGGTKPKVHAVFEAFAYAAGVDGKADTDDDVLIGILPAKWSVAAFDEQAIKDEDVKFAGTIDEATGEFTPGIAGPNPERKYGTNNTGHLSVVAEVSEANASLTAAAELIVTVQRWNNPPIR